MLDAFVEGVRSITQACQLVVLVPVAALVLAGRARAAVVGAAVGGVVLGGWLFVTRSLVLDDTAIRWSGLLVVALVVAVGLPALAETSTVAGRWLPSGALRPLRHPALAPAAVALVAVVATTWWRPCVGEQLGRILTSAPDEPVAQAPATFGFMLGMALPLVAVGLLVAAIRPPARPLAIGSLAAGGVTIVLAASVVAGQQGEIVAQLLEWSQ